MDNVNQDALQELIKMEIIVMIAVNNVDLVVMQIHVIHAKETKF